MIIWQTGEPPCEIDLLVEYEFKPGRNAISMLQHRDGAWHDECDEAMPPIAVLRWSTLDAAPDVVGRLEEYAKKHFTQSVLIDYMVRQDTFEIGRYDPSEGEYHNTTSAPTLAAAIEQMCGGTDES